MSNTSCRNNDTDFGRNCPGGSNVIKNITNEFGRVNATTTEGSTYDITIPQAIKDLYDGGRQKFGKTMSSFFDIHTRQFTYISMKGYNGNQKYPVPSFRILDSRVLEEKQFPVQGLVVDMINGGIGFRNHTVPRGLDQGAEWSEDLLFLQPETACVDTNLTLEFTVPDSSALGKFSADEVFLVDNGGFANLNQQYPAMSMQDNQNHPQLRGRAYKAAWLLNVYSALIMNVTRPAPGAFSYLNSELGKKFKLDGGSSGAGAGGISMDSFFSSLISSQNYLKTWNNSITNQSMTTGYYTNPFKISGANYSDISLLCQGAGGRDYANSSNLNVQCGLFFAAAVRKDGKDTLMVEPNSTWTQNVYTCASLTKALIKTVGFRYNATLGNDLKALIIQNITTKKYEHESDMPLWGVEEPSTPMQITAITQLWGLVSDNFNPADAKKNSIFLKRSPELYLPGYTGLAAGLMPLTSDYQYLPASSWLKDLLATSYHPGATTGLNIDYTGNLNLAMFKRWQRLSQNFETVPEIIHLIWTDLAANVFQGTRGWMSKDSLSKRDEGLDSDNLVPVLVYHRRIQYKWVYAIPAFIVLGLVGGLVVITLILSFMRRAPYRLRYYLNQLSPGRLLAEQYYPARCEKDAVTEIWVEKVGRELIDLTRRPEGGTALAHEQKPLMDTKDDVHTSSVEMQHNGETYPMSSLNGRSHQGYMQVGQAQ